VIQFQPQILSGGVDPFSSAQRYKSYDPASGTYLGYDGLRHPCGPQLSLPNDKRATPASRSFSMRISSWRKV